MSDTFQSAPPVPAWGMPQPPAPKKTPWFKKPVIIFPNAALLVGVGIGSTMVPEPEVITVEGPKQLVEKRIEVKTTPEACLNYITFSEQGFTYSSEAMGYMNEALQAAGKLDAAGITAASGKLDILNPKFAALLTKSNAAKAECRAAK